MRAAGGTLKTLSYRLSLTLDLDMSEVVSWNWISFGYVYTSSITTAFIRTHYKQSQVSTIEGLEADDRALVARLLEKVKKTCEKDFVHGRCLNLSL